MSPRALFVKGVLIAAVLSAAVPAAAHKIYMMNDNHTDYGWNATVQTYELSMLDELDYYLDRVDATSANAPAEQARFNGDNWYYMYLYQNNRTPAQFQRLINRFLDGHITFPLNPFVELYGALPTEAAIRAGYYPGRMERAYGLRFLLAQQEEDATVPWGVSQVWAGSRAKYTWRSVCECFHLAPYLNRTDEVFRWQAPDNSELLMKWYQPPGDSGQTWGGYAEMRSNFSQFDLQTAINRFSARAPFVPITGLFGAGWDDVSWKTDNMWQLAQAWNAAHPGGDQAIMSNGVDYFADLENYRSQLNQVRGGWGNDWDVWPMKLASVVSRCKRAFEKLRSAEALSVLAQWGNPNFWSTRQPLVEAASIDMFKVFEHTWADGGVGTDSIIANKKTWTSDLETKVDTVYSDAANQIKTFFRTPDEDRILVFNPLGFARTDFADLAVTGTGPYVVIDVSTGTEVPSQVVTVNGSLYLRFLATNVPALGYATYRYAAGSGASFPTAATISGSTIANAKYSVTLGTRGQITNFTDVPNNRQLAGSGLNDFGSGTAAAPTAINVGPVSTTITTNISGTPARRVSITLFNTAIDRVMIDDEILQNYTTASYYKFNVNLASAQVHFEEVGAIARPGLVSQGGDFQPGTRADLMTLNHFVELASGNYVFTLSNWDALTFRPGASTTSTFDLTTPEINVLALGIVSPESGDISNQGGDTYFHHGFALRGRPGAYSGADAMRFSLAHQNPLITVALPRNQSTAPLANPTRSLMSVNASDVVVTAFKPVEESARGFLARLWELDGVETSFTADLSAFAPQSLTITSLNETDTGAGSLNSNGTLPVALAANEMKTYRFIPGAFGDGSIPQSCTIDAQCDDGSVCDGLERCQSGSCVNGTPLNCSDEDLCTNDTCDPHAGCSHTTTGSVADLRLHLTRLSNPGQMKLTVVGKLFPPAPLSPAINPVQDGIALRIAGNSGQSLVSLQIPGGSGWTTSRLGWQYRDPSGTLNGVRSALVRVTDDGGGKTAIVGVKVRGRNGSYPVAPPDLPITLQILPGSTGSQCGEVQFTAAADVRPHCRFNAKATSLRCS